MMKCQTPLFKHLMSSMEQDQQNDIHMEANGIKVAI